MNCPDCEHPILWHRLIGGTVFCHEADCTCRVAERNATLDYAGMLAI